MSFVCNPFEQFFIVEVGVSNLSVYLCFAVFLVLVSCSYFFSERACYYGSSVQWFWYTCYVVVLSVVVESIGRLGSRYVSSLFILFCGLLVCNVGGMIPYSFTVTSSLVFVFGVALIVFVGKGVLGFYYMQWSFLEMFIPSGSPFTMSVFFVFIEFIGFFIPLVSLCVRLFANMMAGHVLLNVLFGFSWSMLLAGGVVSVMHVIPLLVLFLLLFLETAVGFIQAYVFCLLVCIYIQECVVSSH